MAVYTVIEPHELQAFLSTYTVGELVTYHGIIQGITNTNYRVKTTSGQYILTIFEDMNSSELVFYLQLTTYLEKHGITCPTPVALKNGNLASQLKNKPAALIHYLEGIPSESPSMQQCNQVGAMLALMHEATLFFPLKQVNPRGPNWWNQQAKQLLVFLPPAEKRMLESELNWLNSRLEKDLPNGIIHADLFKDNVLFWKNKVNGFIDFYYACNGIFIYDLAITINDWARTPANTINLSLEKAIMAGYESNRPLLNQEIDYLPIAKRAAAIRFWISRLHDLYFPKKGTIMNTKDPREFYHLLNLYRSQQSY
ncbi:MAG: homoserine kinase [Neisseriaceae bacterium]